MGDYSVEVRSPTTRALDDDRRIELRQWCVEQASGTYMLGGRGLLDEAQAIYDWVVK